MRGMRKLRENLPNFTLKYLVPVGKGGTASSRRAYKLTRKGEGGGAMVTVSHRPCHKGLVPYVLKGE